MVVILLMAMFVVLSTLSRVLRESVNVARRSSSAKGGSIIQNASPNPGKAQSECVSLDSSWPARPAIPAGRIHI